MKKIQVIPAVTVIIIMLLSCSKKEPISPTPSPSPTPMPVCTAIIGNAAENADGSYGAYLMGTIIAMARDSSIDSISVRLSADSQYRVGLYADSVGAPSFLIAQSAVCAGTAGTWNTAAIPHTNLAKNTSYWLIAISENNGIGVYSAGSAVGNGGYAYLWADAVTTMPGSILSWNFTLGEVKIYGNGCF